MSAQQQEINFNIENNTSADAENALARAIAEVNRIKSRIADKEKELARALAEVESAITREQEATARVEFAKAKTWADSKAAYETKRSQETAEILTCEELINISVGLNSAFIGGTSMGDAGDKTICPPNLLQNKVINKAEPKNQILKFSERLSLSEPLTNNAIVPLLDEQSMHAFTLTCKHYRNQYKNKHADKKIAADMLHCVLNPTLPNYSRFLKLLSTPRRDQNGQPLYLIQNHGEEVYFNQAGVKKTKTMRYSTNVLEALLRTKNFHFAKRLFNCIPEQEKTEKLQRYISVIKSQDIWGMPELQLAYKNFVELWQALDNNDDERWAELDRLSGRIGQALKEHLPWFSIYLFCQPVTHSNADYTRAPNWSCILWDNSELDLDCFGSGSIYKLHKGRGATLGVDSAFVNGMLRYHACDSPSYDSAAFSSQSKVLSAEMDKTIKEYGLDEPKLNSETRLAIR